MCDYDEWKHRCGHFSYPPVQICNAALANYKNKYKCDLRNIVFKVTAGNDCPDCTEEKKSSSREVVGAAVASSALSLSQMHQSSLPLCFLLATTWNFGLSPIPFMSMK